MGVSKPTEMTIRDLLQEELRKRGVKVVPEFSVSTPAGMLKPDILLKNGAPYVVETKLGAIFNVLKFSQRFAGNEEYLRLFRRQIRFNSVRNKIISKKRYFIRVADG